MTNLLLKKLNPRWCPGLGEQGIRAATRRAYERRSAVLSGWISPARFAEAECRGQIYQHRGGSRWCPGPDLNRHAVASEGF